MKQEEKQLILIDLCARLPYEVKGLITIHKNMNENSTFNGVINGKLYDRFANLQNSWYDNIPSIKPYLRPMSSMTEKETEIFNSDFGGIEDGYNSIEIKRIDWLNSHHFDYRGLIEKGLAIKAPEEMYII